MKHFACHYLSCPVRSVCPAGAFCKAQSGAPEPCPDGHFCPRGSTEPHACPGKHFCCLWFGQVVVSGVRALTWNWQLQPRVQYPPFYLYIASSGSRGWMFFWGKLKCWGLQWVSASGWNLSSIKSTSCWLGDHGDSLISASRETSVNFQQTHEGMISVGFFLPAIFKMMVDHTFTEHLPN